MFKLFNEVRNCTNVSPNGLSEKNLNNEICGKFYVPTFIFNRKAIYEKLIVFEL